MNFDYILRSSSTVLMLAIFSAFLVENVLGSTKDRRRLLYWTLGMVMLVVLRTGLDQVELFVEGKLIPSGFFDDFWLKFYYIADFYVSFLLPPIVVLFSTVFIYRESLSTKVFVSTFFGFWACVIHEYPFEFMRLPFLGADRGDGLRERPELWFNTFLLFICMVIFYYGFKKFVCPPIKKSIEITNGDLADFIFIPIFCSLILISLISVLSGNRIEMTSVSSESVWIFILTVGVLIFLFVILYWSLFKGLTLSTLALSQKAELDVAAHIQKSALPCDFSEYERYKEFFDIYAVMNPAKEVGGDFYDFFMIDDDHIAVAVADVSGKGVPAALFMMTAKTLIKSLALSKYSPDKVIEVANSRLCMNNEAEMFVTAWFGIYELSTRKLSFVNAGHNPPILCSSDEVFYMDHKRYKRSIMMGIRDNVKYHLNEIYLSSDCHLLLYTDGITEAINFSKELYGEERLISCVKSSYRQSSKDMIENIVDDVDKFSKNEEQFDDMTMLDLRIM